MRLKLPAQPACQCAGPEAPWAPCRPKARGGLAAANAQKAAAHRARAGTRAGARAGRGRWRPRPLARQAPAAQDAASPGSRPRWQARARSQAQWAGRGRILVCQRPRRQVPCMTPARMRRRRDRCHLWHRTSESARAHHGTVARAMAMRLLFPWASTHGPCQSVPRLSGQLESRPSQINQSPVAVGTGNGTALKANAGGPGCRPPGSARRDLAIVPPGASGGARLAQRGHCRSLPPAAGYFAPSHGGTSKSAWGACAWPLSRRLRPQRPWRLRARDIGRGASSLAYAAPISRSLATIQENLTDDGRKIERAPRGSKIPRAVWRALRREAFASIDACLTQRANYRGCKSAGLASRAENRPSCPYVALRVTAA